MSMVQPSMHQVLNTAEYSVALTQFKFLYCCSSVCIYGGGNRRQQISVVEKGVDIVIGKSFVIFFCFHSNKPGHQPRPGVDKSKEFITPNESIQANTNADKRQLK